MLRPLSSVLLLATTPLSWAATPTLKDLEPQTVDEAFLLAEKYRDLYGNPDFESSERKQKNLFVDELQSPENNHIKLPKIDEGNPPPPVVIMHGLLDAGILEIGFCIQLAWKYGCHVKCLNTADLLASAYVRADDQLKHMTAAIQGDATLVQHAAFNNQGFHLVGISQGGLLARAYVQRVNNPVVKRLLSWTGVQNGIATCPASTSPKLCAMFEGGLVGGPYNSFLIFSDYFRDPTDKVKYLRENRFLADVNNERRQGCFHSKTPAACNITAPRVMNQKYADNLKNLDYYIQIEATADSMIYPHASEAHGEYPWGRTGDMHDNLQVVGMNMTEEYRDDVVGLKTLNENVPAGETEGKIRHWVYYGQHVQVPIPMWKAWLMPALGGEKPAPSGLWGAKDEAVAEEQKVKIMVVENEKETLYV